MFASLFGRRFWITAYILLIAGFVVPGNYEILRPTIPILLGGILFFSCLKIAPCDIAQAASQPGVWWRLSWLTMVKLIILPVIAWGVVYVIAPKWAPGVLLMAMMPGSFSSLAFADLYNGNRLTALLLMMVGSLTVPITVPLLMAVCADGDITLAESAHEAGYVTLLLFCPFIAAQIIRKMAPKWIERNYAHLSPAAIACVCTLIFVAVVVNRTSWEGIPLKTISIPLGLTTLAICIFALGSWLQGRFLEQRDAIAFMCTVVYMNNGLAVAYASKFHAGDPYILLPAIMVQFPMMAGIVFVSRFSR